LPWFSTPKFQRKRSGGASFEPGNGNLPGIGWRGGLAAKRAGTTEIHGALRDTRVNPFHFDGHTDRVAAVLEVFAAGTGRSRPPWASGDRSTLAARPRSAAIRTIRGAGKPNEAQEARRMLMVLLCGPAMQSSAVAVRFYARWALVKYPL
jgi:hypothetical protein